MPRYAHQRMNCLACCSSGRGSRWRASWRILRTARTRQRRTACQRPPLAPRNPNMRSTRRSSARLTRAARSSHRGHSAMKGPTTSTPAALSVEANAPRARNVKTTILTLLRSSLGSTRIKSTSTPPRSRVGTTIRIRSGSIRPQPKQNQHETLASNSVCAANSTVWGSWSDRSSTPVTSNTTCPYRKPNPLVRRSEIDGWCRQRRRSRRLLHSAFWPNMSVRRPASRCWAR